jgi:hypothetical protein
LDRDFVAEILYQTRKDNLIIEFKESMESSSLVYSMIVVLKSNKKVYTFKMSKEEWDKMRFLIDVVEEERKMEYAIKRTRLC